MSRFLPPSKVAGADITNCIIGDGCQINPGCTVTNSMIGLRSVISEDCVIEDSLLMGCDYYEKPIECELLPGCLPIGIGEGCTIKKAIVDKNARIGPGVSLVNKENIQESFQWEEQGIVIKDGIIIVLKDGIVPSGF